MSRDDFVTHWNDVHKPLVDKLPGLIDYRQFPAIDHKSPWPFDGLAELRFASLGDVRAAFASPEAQKMREDEPNFLSDIQWYIVEE